MMRLAHSDLCRVLAAVQQIHSHTDFPTLPHLMVKLQAELVRNDFCAFTAFSKSGQMLQAAHDRPDIDIGRLAPALEAHYHEHPVVTHCKKTNEIGTWKISDFLTQTKFERLGLYNEFYKPVAARYQTVSYLVNNEEVEMHLAFNRQSKDFSERDRMIANLLRPHFAQAYTNAKAFHEMRQWELRTHGALESNRVGLIFLTGELNVERMTENCERWLNEYFARQQNASVQLPDQLRRWVVQQCDFQNADGALGNARPPLVIEGLVASLTVRFVQDALGNAALLLSEQRKFKTPRFVPMPVLSARENDVLKWMVEGKRNGEIASILHISERTVEKHVAEILTCLHAENRATAIVHAMEFGTAASRAMSGL